MATAAEVEMERLEGGGLEDLTQRAERVLPRLRFLGPVPAREFLELSDQAGTVVLHSGAKIFDRNQHSRRSVSGRRYYRCVLKLDPDSSDALLVRYRRHQASELSDTHLVLPITGAWL